MSYVLCEGVFVLNSWNLRIFDILACFCNQMQSFTLRWIWSVCVYVCKRVRVQSITSFIRFVWHDLLCWCRRWLASGWAHLMWCCGRLKRKIEYSTGSSLSCCTLLPGSSSSCKWLSWTRLSSSVSNRYAQKYISSFENVFFFFCRLLLTN